MQEAKNRFGTPSRTNANVLAVRKFLNDKMASHKLRPTHINKVLPLAVELVFVTSSSEEEAIEIGRLARKEGLFAWVARAWDSLFGVVNVDSLN